METKTEISQLTPGAQAEIQLYRQDVQDMQNEISKLRQGEVAEDDFKKYRLQRGIYGQKQKPDIQMVRIKIPWGQLTADQLDCLADLSEKFAGEDRKGISHITTRQAIQFHFVKLDQIPECMDGLRKIGLTTREACANTVRNVTADPLAGVAQDEVFDVSPYAEAAARFFLRHPVCQSLARKFKITFSGSSEDRGLIPMHDLGCLAEIKKEKGIDQKGFIISVGGGLGPTPKTAQVLEPFTSENDLLRTIQAVLFVFNRDWDYGRKNRNMARMKFLIEKIGMDEFKKRVFAQRELLKDETYPPIAPFTEEPPNPQGPFIQESHDPMYLRWKSTNVMPQKQDGYSIVNLLLPLGDIRSNQLRSLSKLCRKYGNSLVRTTVQQNLVVRWVKNEALYSFYRGLAETGLHLPSAGRLADITSCPGADTCQLGITSSRGLATAIRKIFANGRSQDADLKDVKIKISGCPNSCGQHHIADIGFYGGAKSINGHQVPTYSMLLGGHIGTDGSGYGKHFLRVPAKKIPSVVGKLLDIYHHGKNDGEKFRQFVTRTGLETLKKELEPLTLLSGSIDPDLHSDWGQSGEFEVQTGPGECAA